MDSDVSGVVIAAPTAQHYALAKKALMADRHVFVEKPLALEVEDAKKLCNLAKDRGKTLMVGQLQCIYSNRLNLGKFRNEQNILWSFAPHDISMILSLIGDVQETIYATGACHLNPKVQDVTTIHLSFKNDIQAHVFVSWLHPFKGQKLVVAGDRGMAVFDDGLP